MEVRDEASADCICGVRPTLVGYHTLMDFTCCVLDGALCAGACWDKVPPWGSLEPHPVLRVEGVLSVMTHSVQYGECVYLVCI